MEITKGRSVDVVSDPATTNGLFESVQKDKQVTNTEGGQDMEITLKAVMEDKKIMEELRAHIREELEVESGVVALQESNEALEEENKELRAEIAEQQKKEDAYAAGIEIDKMLKESKLPEGTKIEAGLRKILEAADSTEARKAIIENFERVSEEARKSVTSVKGPSLEYPKRGNNTENVVLKEGTLVTSLASALSARR
jgi:hypothetical protein